MTRAGVAVLAAVSTMVTIGFVAQGWSEDGVVALGVDCGNNCAATGSSGGFHAAVPGGTFVVTVAHLAPNLEDALTRNKPRTCEPIRARVDTLTVKAADGSVAVDLGERKQLAAGQATRLVHTVPSQGAGARFDLDQVGFRVRSDATSRYCRVVTSGQFFADGTSTPISFDLIPGDSKR